MRSGIAHVPVEEVHARSRRNAWVAGVVIFIRFLAGVGLDLVAVGIEEGESDFVFRLVLQPVPDAYSGRLVFTSVEHLALRFAVFALGVNKCDRRAKCELVALGRAAVAPAEGGGEANLGGRLDQMDVLACEVAGYLSELANAVHNPE